jgi:hypothetical protein
MTNETGKHMSLSKPIMAECPYCQRPIRFQPERTKVELAAPELLAALEYLIQWAAVNDDDDQYLGEHRSVQMARAAIAKARGE